MIENQLTLRKLLLWTATVAILLGMTMMDETVAVFVLIPACWVIIVGTIQLLTNPIVARCVSEGAGLAPGVFFALRYLVRGDLAGCALSLVFFSFIGLLFGRTFFVVAAVLCLCVDWIDKLFSWLNVKPNEPTHDD